MILYASPVLVWDQPEPAHVFVTVSTNLYEELLLRQVSFLTAHHPVVDACTALSRAQAVICKVFSHGRHTSIDNIHQPAMQVLCCSQTCWVIS